MNARKGRRVIIKKYARNNVRNQDICVDGRISYMNDRDREETVNLIKNIIKRYTTK